MGRSKSGFFVFKKMVLVVIAVLIAVALLIWYLFYMPGL
jgi:cytoskeletal protein RodZ